MHARIRHHGRRSAAVAGLLAALAVAACGASDSNESASTGTASDGEGVTLNAAQYSWSAAALTTAIIEEIAKQNPQLGVAGIEHKQLDPATAWAGAQRGDIDFIAEVAMPNQQPMADKAKDEVELLKETYGNANQGWFVPSYAVQPGGAAEGLRSVTQLNEYREALGGKLYDADPGWITTQQNEKRLEGYGLDLEHVTSSEAAELAQLERAYERKEPILAYLYRPHWVFTEYDLTQLEEPKAYEPGCLEDGDGACAMPPYSAWVAARRDLAEKAPRFHRMLGRLSIPLEEVETMLAQVDMEKRPVAEVAAEWVNGNRETIATWVG